MKLKFDELIRETNKFLLDNEPIKQYKIYEIDDENMSTNEQYFYDEKIAKEIYSNMVNLNESAFNSFPELMDFYSEDMSNMYSNIESLKKQDEEKYQKDLEVYRNFCDSDIFIKLKEEVKRLKKENHLLQKQIENNKKTINLLLKKLKISLDRIEVLQNKSYNFWKKIQK